MQQMTPTTITTDIDTGNAFLGFAFVLAFYAVVGLTIAAFVAA